MYIFFVSSDWWNIAGEINWWIDDGCGRQKEFWRCLPEKLKGLFHKVLSGVEGIYSKGLVFKFIYFYLSEHWWMHLIC